MQRYIDFSAIKLVLSFYETNPPVIQCFPFNQRRNLKIIARSSAKHSSTLSDMTAICIVPLGL